MGTLSKAWRLIRNRPGHFLSTLRGYVLFMRTRLFQGLFYGPASGILLGENARVQRLSCLSAEKPDARVSVGADSVIYENAKIEAYGQGRIEIGEGVILGDVRIYARASIRIGARVVSSWNVFIQDFDPHPVEPELRALQMRQMTENFRPSYRPAKAAPELSWVFPVASIEIGDDVWLGANCTIMKGARIGAGSVVAASAVVTGGDYPPRSILAGVPAKVIKTL
jgi:acetyltransferase-like isoleucine patch superfamily enzyme